MKHITKEYTCKQAKLYNDDDLSIINAKKRYLIRSKFRIKKHKRNELHYLKNSDYVESENLIHLKVFSISLKDDIANREDDPLTFCMSFEEKSNNNYVIGFHILDIISLLNENPEYYNKLFKEKREGKKSLWKEYTKDFYGNKFIEKNFSFREKDTKSFISYFFKTSSSGRILKKEQPKRTFLQIRKNFSLSEFHKLLEGNKELNCLNINFCKFMDILCKMKAHLPEEKKLSISDDKSSFRKLAGWNTGKKKKEDIGIQDQQEDNIRETSNEVCQMREKNENDIDLNETLEKKSKDKEYVYRKLPIKKLLKRLISEVDEVSKIFLLGGPGKQLNGKTPKYVGLSFNFPFYMSINEEIFFKINEFQSEKRDHNENGFDCKLDAYKDKNAEDEDITEGENNTVDESNIEDDENTEDEDNTEDENDIEDEEEGKDGVIEKDEEDKIASVIQDFMHNFEAGNVSIESQCINYLENFNDLLNLFKISTKALLINRICFASRYLKVKIKKILEKNKEYHENIFRIIKEKNNYMRVRKFRDYKMERLRRKHQDILNLFDISYLDKNSSSNIKLYLNKFLNEHLFDKKKKFVELFNYILILRENQTPVIPKESELNFRNGIDVNRIFFQNIDVKDIDIDQDKLSERNIELLQKLNDEVANDFKAKHIMNIILTEKQSNQIDEIDDKLICCNFSFFNNEFKGRFEWDFVIINFVNVVKIPKKLFAEYCRKMFLSFKRDTRNEFLLIGK